MRLASGFVSEGLAEYVLVQRKVGDEALEASVFILQLSHPPKLAHAQMRKPLLPKVERGFAHADPIAEIRDRRASFDLPQGIRDLFLREIGSLHLRLLPSRAGMS